MEPSPKRKKGGGMPFAFVALPKGVLHSSEYQQLPSSAKVLLLDLVSQYTGKNNGRLTPAWSALKEKGWASNNTVLSAKKALLTTSFAVMTRKGHPPRTCEWIAFTWWRLDWNKKMDIDPKGFPYLNFLNIQSQSIDPNIGRKKYNA
jgi:hypothetical protein